MSLPELELWRRHDASRLPWIPTVMRARGKKKKGSNGCYGGTTLELYLLIQMILPGILDLCLVFWVHNMYEILSDLCLISREWALTSCPSVLNQYLQPFHFYTFYMHLNDISLKKKTHTHSLAFTPLGHKWQIKPYMSRAIIYALNEG